MDTFFIKNIHSFSIVFRVKYPLRPIHGIVLYAGIYGSTEDQSFARTQFTLIPQF